MGLLDKLKKTKKEAEKPQEKVGKVDVEKKTEKSEKAVSADKQAKPAKKFTTPQKSKPAKGSKSAAYKVLLQTAVSEKAANAENSGQYTFKVAVNSNKEQIKDAVETVYGVRPKKVRTMNMEGKTVRFGTRFGRRKEWKKAIVILPKGKTINIHEGV